MLRAFGKAARRAADSLRGRKIVGNDANGNVYYIKKELNGDGVEVEKRFVDLQGRDYDPNSLPAEWMLWLSRTRQDPPTGGAAPPPSQARDDAADAPHARAAERIAPPPRA